MCSHPAPWHPIIIVGPFIKWGVDFMDCNLDSGRGNHHIIMVIYYLTKWEEAMLTIKSKGKMIVHFVFNQIVAWFKIPKETVTNHDSHF